MLWIGLWSVNVAFPGHTHLINMIGPTFPMPKVIGFLVREKMLKVYGHGILLGHVTRTIITNISSLTIRNFDMKFEFIGPKKCLNF